MHYYEHSLLSARKFGCAVMDTFKLHKLMDSSKLFFPASQHRVFSHNIWFVHVLTELVGDTIINSRNGQPISTRDILYEHLKEDHNGRTPSLQDWLQCIRMQVPDDHRSWFNHPRESDKRLLLEIREELKNKEHEND